MFVSLCVYVLCIIIIMYSSTCVCSCVCVCERACVQKVANQLLGSGRARFAIHLVNTLVS